MSNPVYEDSKQERALQLGEHKAGFYFKRASMTTLGVLTVVTLFFVAYFIATQLYVASLVSGLTEDVPEDGPGSSYSATCDPEVEDGAAC